MGLVGLVCFCSGIGIRINGISGISMLFESERFGDDAPSFGLYSRGVRRVYVRTWERRRRRKNASTHFWSCVVWAHAKTIRKRHMGTHICRAFIPQCNEWPWSRGLLMEKSSQMAFTQSDMQQFQWRTPSPPHIQCWLRTTTQNARVCEQRKFRKATCCTCTPTLNIGARGSSYRRACKAKCVSKRHLFEFESFANLFPSTVKKHCVPVVQGLARKCVVCLCWACFHSKHRLIPLIQRILICIPFKKQTNPTNPINPDP